MSVHTLGTMREFRTKHFLVRCTAEEEPFPDLSFDDTGEIAEKVDNGTYTVFCAAVRVYFEGEEIGHDFLGNCIYEDFEAFMDHKECGKQNRKWAKQGKAGRCGSYFSGMIHEAITEARKTLKQRRKDYADIYVR